MPQLLRGDGTMALDLKMATGPQLMHRAVVAVAHACIEMGSKPSTRGAFVRVQARQMALASFPQGLQSTSPEAMAQELFITNILLFCMG